MPIPLFDEKPENSSVCADANDDTEILALKALAFVGSVTDTPIAELLELTLKAVVPFDEAAKSFNFPNSPASVP